MDEGRADPEQRWILAVFSTEHDAQEFIGEVRGTLHTSNDDGMGELIARWEAGDDSIAARVEARKAIASTSSTVRDFCIEVGDVGELARRYADQDTDLCRLGALR